MKAKLIITILLLTSCALYAQVDRSSELFRTLKSNDSLLFTVGFNRLDTKPFEDLLSDNFEFYHDEAGITSSKKAFIESINDLSKLSYKPRRQLVENSLEVYPLEKNGVLYGAVQTGEHQFYAIENDKSEHITSIAKFTHVWLLENGKWKLTRVLSYAHQEPNTTDSVHQKSYVEETINQDLLFHNRVETEKWLAKNHIPALGIGYIEDGKIQEAVVYGKNEQGKPNPINTIFNVASLTKPITAMVALTLVNAGKWNLDEPVYTYWTDPDIAGDPRTKKLTTRYILSHQSGFPNWRGKQPDGKLTFEFEPGTKYQYSGEGFEYLRKALEKNSIKLWTN